MKGGEKDGRKSRKYTLTTNRTNASDIELLEGDTVKVFGGEFAEFERKMHEIRRDSIRFIGELKPWTRQ